MNLTKKKYEEEIRKAKDAGARVERERIAKVLEELAFPNLIVEKVREDNKDFTLRAMSNIFKQNYHLLPHTIEGRVQAVMDSMEYLIGMPVGELLERASAEDDE